MNQSPREAVFREALEETGFEVSVLKVAAVFDRAGLRRAAGDVAQGEQPVDMERARRHMPRTTCRPRSRSAASCRTRSAACSRITATPACRPNSINRAGLDHSRFRINRHSRASGNPGQPLRHSSLDPRFRGRDGEVWWQAIAF